MFKEFGVTNLEVTKDDIYKNPSNPILSTISRIQNVTSIPFSITR